MRNQLGQYTEVLSDFTALFHPIYGHCVTFNVNDKYTVTRSGPLYGRLWFSWLAERNILETLRFLYSKNRF